MSKRRESLISKPPSDLDDLQARVSAAQDKYRPKPEKKHDGAVLGMAWRLSTELVVAVLVGTALGYGLDKLFGTQPWLILLGVGFGFAAGIRNTLRTAARMDAENADVPLGEDIGFDDEDDD